MNYIFLIATLLLLFISISCDDNQFIRHYRLEKEAAQKKIPEQTSPKSEIYWTAPTNWISSQGSSMRIGSFTIPFSNGNGDLSVIKLGGSAGGLAPNINRWRGQINLGSHEEEEIQKYIKTGESRMGSFRWLTILNSDNDETAFIVSIFETDTHTIFVKLSASQTGVLELKKEFLEFCKSFGMNTL